MHSALSNKFHVEDEEFELFIYAVIVGNLDEAVPTMLARAVKAYAAGTTPQTAKKPIDFFRKFIRLTPYLLH